MNAGKGAPQGAPFFVGALAACLLAALSCSRVDSLRVESTLRTGAQPEGLALSPDGSRLAVACQRSNDVWIHNLKSPGLSRVDTLPGPEDVMFDDGGRLLLVSESGADSVAQVSLAEMRVTRRFKVMPQPLRMARLAGRLLISSLSETGIGVFRSPGLRAEKTLRLSGFAEKVEPSPDGRQIYAVTRDSPAFLKFRAADMSQQLSVLVNGTPVDMALSPDGEFAWVAGEGKFFEGGEEGQESVPGAVTLVRLSDGRAVDWSPACAAIRAIALSQSGRYLYVVCGEEGELQVMDAHSFEQKASLSLPGDPAEILVSPDGRRLYVSQRDLKQVSVVLSGPWR